MEDIGKTLKWLSLVFITFFLILLIVDYVWGGKLGIEREKVIPLEIIIFLKP
jgi:hypothetical protein